MGWYKKSWNREEGFLKRCAGSTEYTKPIRPVWLKAFVEEMDNFKERVEKHLFQPLDMSVMDSLFRRHYFGGPEEPKLWERIKELEEKVAKLESKRTKKAVKPKRKR